MEVSLIFEKHFHIATTSFALKGQISILFLVMLAVEAVFFVTVLPQLAGEVEFFLEYFSLACLFAVALEVFREFPRVFAGHAVGNGLEFVMHFPGSSDPL